MTKVTSYGSQSGLPSAPNPTPTTEALDSDVTDPPPPMDFAAVTRILAPVTEELNEAADVAMLPSPPMCTPVVGSPVQSVKWPFPAQRSRGLSLIGDRLAKLKIDARRTRCRRDAAEITTSSLLSDEPSIAEDNESDMASISEVMSDVVSEGCKEKICAQCPGHVRTCFSFPLASTLGLSSVPIALGSPVLNPRIEEYLSFTSKDLPTQAPEPATGATLAEHASSTSATVLDANSMCNSFNDDGVTEKSNWAEELEDAFTRTLLRFEQLAKDEHTADPSKDISEYYVSRLRTLLGNSKRQVPVKIEKVENVEEAQQK